MTLSSLLWLGGAGLVALGLAVGWPRRRGRRNALRALAGLLVLGLAAVALLGGLLLRQYRWLRDDAPVATLALHQLGPQSFEGTLQAEGRVAEALPLHGDEWQLDARVIRWRLPVDLPPLVRLERLAGRYGDPKQERTGTRDSHDLRARWDFWQFHQRWLAALPIAQAHWGSAAYLPMLDGARYDVFADASGGLTAKPADEETARKLKAAGW